MASLIYDSFLDEVQHAAIDLDLVTVKAMLVTSAYAPDKGVHTKRSDVTNEVTGTGYTAGGQASTVTVAKDVALHKITTTLAGMTWPTSTITARGAVYYVSRGGASSADELIAYDDFGSNIVTSGGTFTLEDTVLTNQN